MSAASKGIAHWHCSTDARRLGVSAQGGADAFDLIGSDADAGACPAEQDSFVSLSRLNVQRDALGHCRPGGGSYPFPVRAR